MTKEELRWHWENESVDETEWRDELNAEEFALVEEWDSQFDQGMTRIAQDILKYNKGVQNNGK